MEPRHDHHKEDESDLSLCRLGLPKTAWGKKESPGIGQPDLGSDPPLEKRMAGGAHTLSILPYVKCTRTFSPCTRDEPEEVSSGVG